MPSGWKRMDKLRACSGLGWILSVSGTGPHSTFGDFQLHASCVLRVENRWAVGNLPPIDNPARLAIDRVSEPSSLDLESFTVIIDDVHP